MGREGKGKIKGRKGRTEKRSVYGGRQHESKGIHLQGVEAANQPISSEQRLSWKPGKHSCALRPCWQPDSFSVLSHCG